MTGNDTGTPEEKIKIAEQKITTMLTQSLYAIGKDAGYISTKGIANPKAVEIGEMLNAQGGLSAMQSAAKVVVALLQDRHGIDRARELEHCWHGIGDWLG